MDGLIDTKRSLKKLDDWKNGSQLYFFLMKDKEAGNYFSTILDKLLINKPFEQVYSSLEYSECFKNNLKEKLMNNDDSISPYIILNLIECKTDLEIGDQLNAVFSWYEEGKKMNASTYIILPEFFGQSLPSFYHWTLRTGMYGDLDDEILIEKRADKLEKELAIKPENIKKKKI